MKPAIYLDNNATTFLDPLVAQRMHELNLAGVANPASQHAPGRQALHLLEQAKSDILQCVGAALATHRADRIILTSGGTEANNLAICGSLAKRPGKVIVGGTDHPSVIEAAKLAASRVSEECRVLPVDALGQCDLNQLEDWLRAADAQGKPVALVSIMLGNNETGITQELAAITSLCSRYGVPVHSDVVQAVGKMPVDLHGLGLAALTLTAHKLHGPVGIGALITTEGFELEPTIVGGGQQLGIRAGTEPVVPAIGFALAVERICEALSAGDYQRVQELRDQFESRLLELEDCLVVGQEAPRLPHTSNLSFLGVDRQALQMALDLKGVACSTGSACSSGSGRPSGSLVAMGLPEAVVQGSLRFSFSRFSTQSDVDSATRIVSEAVTRCRPSTV